MKYVKDSVYFFHPLTLGLLQIRQHGSSRGWSAACAATGAHAAAVCAPDFFQPPMDSAGVSWLHMLLATLCFAVPLQRGASRLASCDSSVQEAQHAQ